MSTEKAILIIEDEAQIRKFLRISFEAHGFVVHESRLGKDGVEQCAKVNPDLIILDLGLPDIDGLEVIKAIREWSRIPILVLSVRDSELEKVDALDHGANDYVTKPFGIAELMARIRATLRSQEIKDQAPSVYDRAELYMDYVQRRVKVDGEEIKLSNKEYQLLRLLTGASGSVLTHQALLREIWGQEVETHYLRVLVGQLRQRLGDSPSHPRFIETIQGVGYRLVPDD